MKLNLQGRFGIQLIRKGELVSDLFVNNGIVDLAKNNILDVYFGSQTKSPSWYIGLIGNAGFVGLSNNDTIATHPGWSENTSYSETIRPTWLPNPAMTRSLTTSVEASFTINLDTTIRGVFLCNDNVKGGFTGLLWCTAIFAPKALIGGTDVLRINYNLDA